MIVVFDLGGPLLAHTLLRPAGLSAVAAPVLSGILPALGCLVSLRCSNPLIFRLAVELIGPDTARGIRVAIVATTSTGITLVCSKLVPYLFAISVSVDAGLRRAREAPGRHATGPVTGL